MAVSYSFNVLDIYFKFLPDKNILVSSANKTDRLVVVIVVKSLMYSKKNNGPRIDPCGTPYFIFSLPDLTLLYVKYCKRWASCQIRKIAGAHAPGMPGTFSPSPHVSDPDMHHGTCMTHVPWCMPGSLTSGFILNRRRGKTFPAFPAHAQPAILRIW